VLEGLFGGENLDEAAREGVEIIGPRDVHMERGGIELGKDVNLVESGIDAVGYRDVHNAVLAAEWDGRF